MPLYYFKAFVEKTTCQVAQSSNLTVERHVVRGLVFALDEAFAGAQAHDLLNERGWDFAEYICIPEDVAGLPEGLISSLQPAIDEANKSGVALVFEPA